MTPWTPIRPDRFRDLECQIGAVRLPYGPSFTVRVGNVRHTVVRANGRHFIAKAVRGSDVWALREREWARKCE